MSRPLPITLHETPQNQNSNIDQRTSPTELVHINRKHNLLRALSQKRTVVESKLLGSGFLGILLVLPYLEMLQINPARRVGRQSRRASGFDPHKLTNARAPPWRYLHPCRALVNTNSKLPASHYYAFRADHGWIALLFRLHEADARIQSENMPASAVLD
jgi:hypothetical protein